MEVGSTAECPKTTTEILHWERGDLGNGGKTLLRSNPQDTENIQSKLVCSHDKPQLHLVTSKVPGCHAT